MADNQFLNFADEGQFQTAMDYFGGENFLKENFPRILKMLYNTAELHKEKAGSLQEEPAGYEDSYNIVELPVQSANTMSSSVYSQSKMSLVNQASFLHISSKMWDPKHNKVFGAVAVRGRDQNILDNRLIADYSMLSYSKEKHIQTDSSFVSAAKVNGKSVCAVPIPKSLAIDLGELTNDVKNITVSQPAPKQAGDAFIRLVYNGRSDNSAAYNFKKATDSYIGGVRYVKVFFPFSITVELSEGNTFYTPNPVNFDSSFYITLSSDVVKGGEVHFSTAKIGGIAANVNTQGNILTLDFSYSSGDEKNYWGVEMPLTNKQTEGAFDFHLNFNINYRCPGFDNVFTTDIIVTSESLPASPNMRRIIQSKILWGCLGKDTMLCTESGMKKISDITVGEKIFTEKGFVPLKNMVTGTEEKIVALGVSEDATLFITKKHPVATERGIIRAEDIRISDRLLLDDGSYKDIYYFETMDYNDKVYSPELEESALISAEGIMVGDYLTTVDITEDAQQEAEPLEPELLEELERWSDMKNEQMKKEVNV